MTKIADEPLAARLARQERECQGYLRQQDECDTRLTTIDSDMRAASEQDDTDRVLALGKERQQLHARLQELRDLAEAKEHACRATRDQLTQQLRAEHLRLMRAHVATASDIARAFEDAAGDFFDFAKRYAQQLKGAHQELVATGLVRQGGNSPLPTAHDVVAWIMDHLRQAGFPVVGKLQDTHGNMIPLSGPGVSPTALAEIATSIAETTR